MVSTVSVLVSVAAVLTSICVQAATPAGLYFSNNDWELACDNTRTCRIAGYHRDGDDDMAVSVLLTRKAGANQAVTGELQIGSYGENPVLKNLPATFDLSMRINALTAGKIAVGKDSLTASLSASQVAALLAALPGNSKIEWSAGGHIWKLSDKGAAAVLLKMDEFQGRIGTGGALLRKGPQNEDAVLPPVPVPVVIVVPLTKPLPGDAQFANRHSKALWKILRSTVKDDDCPLLTERRSDKEQFSSTRLTDAKFLVTTPCWSAAYNSGDGYWVVDQSPPHRPLLVTASGSSYTGGGISNGNISASHKGRGLGDCWSVDDWTWDGAQFIHTKASSSGMCKLVAPGGAWSLPTITTEVRN